LESTAQRAPRAITADRIGQQVTFWILGGVFSEQVAPFLPDFPKDLKASEARFIGKPVDFLIFKGMDDQHIDEVVFVEIKSGKFQLSNNERSLRDAIQEKRVRRHEYRVDHGISDMPASASSQYLASATDHPTNHVA
jgi:predicted Holliday junction resolvase-like endonuclease